MKPAKCEDGYMTTILRWPNSQTQPRHLWMQAQKVDNSPRSQLLISQLRLLTDLQLARLLSPLWHLFYRVSTFAAKNAGLAMSSSVFPSFPTPSVNTLSNLLPTAPLSDTYQLLLVQQPTLQQTQTPTPSQTRYHMVTTPSPQHYAQPSGVMVNSYSHVFPPLPPGPPPRPPNPPATTHDNSTAASGVNYSATAGTFKFPSSWPISASRNGLLWAPLPVKLIILHRFFSMLRRVFLGEAITEKNDATKLDAYLLFTTKTLGEVQKNCHRKGGLNWVSIGLR
ncbi:hypothetical protein Vadar_007907 [Vaccinium darrowii]|uniref:Uncharacterized protein n=1 Tax=Vaccinium darrowii TaxID=229202 RepID=A0ACB7Z3V1_9ERIC|nr:hypothetical protein Vadar_007907 [Vaccinium darrowii]